MKRQRKQSVAFRPSLNESSLETRLVLNAASVRAAVLGALEARHARVEAAVEARHARVEAPIDARQARLQNALETRQTLRAFRTEWRNIRNNLRNTIGQEVGQLFANGIPTAQQRADAAARINGEIFGAAFQMSSQAALLPNSSRLVNQVQQAILSNSPRSLVTRLVNLPPAVLARGNVQSVVAAMSRDINQTFAGAQARFNAFARPARFNNLTIPASTATSIGLNPGTGANIPVTLRQFMGSQAIAQLGNSLGALSNGFPIVASSGLFPNGALTASPANQLAFINQAGGALGTAAFQLGSDLSLFPTFNPGLGPELQNGFFGTGPTSLFSQIQNLPNASATFNTAANTAFNNGFGSLVGPLGTAFNLPANSFSTTLGTGPFNSMIGPTFDSVSNGFNGGFGSGFVGFGTAPTTFNTNFGTGFGNFVTNANAGFGFNVPTVNTLPVGVPGTGTTAGGTTTFP